MLPVLTLDHAVLPMFARMQATGVPIDRPGCFALARDMQIRKEEILEELHGMLGYYLNPNSDDQVRQLLRELLPAETIDGLKLTEGKEISTGKKVIEALRGIHPPIDSVIEYRQCTKVETTYALPMALEQDPPPPAEPNRARSNLRVTRVASGRLSASKREEGGASLLTLPTRTELGRRVRKQCKVQVPGRCLLTRDLSQIEFRVVAHLSADKAMCRVFDDGLDLHKQTAATIFGKRIEDLHPLNERAPAKNAGFGILFGITAEGLMDQMRVMGVGHLWTVDRCQELLDQWFAVYPGVQRFISTTRAEAASKGYVADMCGRRRYLPGAASSLSWVREEAWRQAVSLKVQGSAQAILKTGMAELWPLLEHHWRVADPYLEPLLQVHDELLFETDERNVDWWMATVDAALTTTTQLRVPITSSGGTGYDWGSLEK